MANNGNIGAGRCSEMVERRASLPEWSEDCCVLVNKSMTTRYQHDPLVSSTLVDE